ncbi:hypothetical protein BV22DRAFT_1076611, partial [Leucogyrophana mollusca]
MPTVSQGGSSSDVVEGSNACRVPTVSDGTGIRSALAVDRVPHPAIVSSSAIPCEPVDVNIDKMIEEYSLNVEQARAFSIVANHSTRPTADALRMFLGGPGGTGKSRVINALKDFFERRGESRRFRLASYMGVAARNIAGMTLHSALALGQRGRGSAKSASRRDLISMWEGVDYLLIDEISMIGCNFLVRISQALT